MKMRGQYEGDMSDVVLEGSMNTDEQLIYRASTQLMWVVVCLVLVMWVTWI